MKYTDTVNNLVDAIKLFYPISTDEVLFDDPMSRLSNTVYPNIDEIVRQKLNILYVEPNSGDNISFGQFDSLLSNHKSLLTGFQKLFQELEVHDWSFRQFPNLAYHIKFKERSMDYIMSTCALNVKISLLTNYYTLFFEESVQVFHETQIKRTKAPLLVNCVSADNEFMDVNQHYINTAKALVEEHFINYNYVPPRLLFDNKFDGSVPFRARPDKISYPLYSFLFERDPVATVAVRIE